MASPDASRTVDAVQTACDVIDALQALDGAGVTELATHLGRSKGTVHSHLSTLKENEYVIKDGDTYRVSLRFMDVAEYAKDRLRITDIVTEELEELAAETGEIAQFAVEEHGRAVYIEKAMGDNAVQTASRVGMRENLHCLALGKAILAHLPNERVEQIVADHGLPAQTAATITDEDELFDELEAIRDRGYAFDNEEKIQGLRCVAAPVSSATGNVIGAISISGPSSRIHDERFREEIPQLVTRAANIIEINAQYS